jgi:pyrroline-5-carboxylate reductase
MKTIGFIGGGRITNILLQGFKKAGTTFKKVVVFDINQEIAGSLQQRHPEIETTNTLQEAVQNVDLLIVAVHPPAMMDVLEAIKECVTDSTVVISLAPKITISIIERILGNTINIARLNPSASTIVNRGVNPIAFSASTPVTIRERLLQFFEKLGTTPVVEESKIEAYAMISAMGPTYFFFQLQKLKELAISYGMEEKEAQKVISDMLWGATETLFSAGLTYPEVVNLIPVKPMGEVESIISGYYEQFLNAIYSKIKP